MLRRAAQALTVFALVSAWAATASAQASTASSTTTPPPSKVEASAAAAAEHVQGPANDVVFETTVGYGVGAFSAIDTHNSPTIAHGPLLHAALGWAWALKANQSLGVLAFGDIQLDGDKSTSDGTKPASRLGAAGALWGEHAHLRLGFGWAHATLDTQSYGGIGIVFGAGWQTTITEGKSKRAVFMFEVLPSWDFLGAGSATLHRWNFGILLGVAVL